MRVCLIGKYRPSSEMSGGIEKYIEDLTSSKEVNFKHIYFGSQELPVKFTILEAPFSSPQSFIKAIEKSKANIIHINLPNPFAEFMLLIYILLHGKKQKIVATYHTDVPYYTFLSYVADVARMFWLLPLLKLCDKIICTSKQYAESTLALKPFLNKVVIVPLGVDTGKINSPRHTILGNKKIIFVGRLHLYKGLNVLLEAFKKVIVQRDNIELLIVGTGPLKETLVNVARKLGLENYVTFTNRVNDSEKNKLLNEADIFVLPSINRGEAFGVSQLDAMYFEKPVISTNINGSGVSFVNKNNETGIVVEPGNPQQLTNAILKLLDNDELRIKMGKNGRKRVLKYFTRKLMIKETLKIYKSLI